MTAPVLVTGGTGTLGRVLVRRLLAAGHEVRVLSRREQPAGERARYAWRTGDLRSGAGIDAAVAGAGTVIHCATTGGRADVAATRHLIDAARRSSGDLHLVYVSIVGVDAVPLRYYRAKLAAEELVTASGLPWTIQRATQFHDLLLRIFGAQRWAPVIMVPAGIDCQPVDAGEVAERLLALAGAAPAGRAPDLGGPQVRGLDDLARAYVGAVGHRRAVLPLPLAGKVVRAFRAGGHLCPEHPDGRITFEQFLAQRLARQAGRRHP